MFTHYKFFAGGSAMAAFLSIAPLWLIFQGDPLGAAIIGIPSVLVLALCLGMIWSFREA